MNLTENRPHLSVILPVYNAEPFLTEAIDSILDQDFRDFECIAIDDGSTDRSGAILDEYAKKDARVHVIHQPNAGLVATLNTGLLLARAPLVARMDADDVCLPGRFSIQVECFAQGDSLAVLGGAIVLIDGEGRSLRTISYPASSEALAAMIEVGSPLAHPAVMFRKDVIERVGGYRPAFSHAEDYDLWLRVHDAGHEIRNLDIPVINYRQHESKVSIVHRRQQTLATIVARLVHRARVAGMVDPTLELPGIDEATLSLFEPRLKAGMEQEIFSIMLGGGIYAQAADIDRASVAFRQLPDDLRYSDHAVDFLIRLARCAFAFGRYPIVLTSMARALMIAPVKTAGMVGRKLVEKFVQRAR